MMAEEEENGMMLPATILTKDSVEKVGQLGAEISNFSKHIVHRIE
jgi:hypothetical protein